MTNNVVAARIRTQTEEFLIHSGRLHTLISNAAFANVLPSGVDLTEIITRSAEINRAG